MNSLNIDILFIRVSRHSKVLPWSGCTILLESLQLLYHYMSCSTQSPAHFAYKRHQRHPGWLILREKSFHSGSGGLVPMQTTSQGSKRPLINILCRTVSQPSHLRQHLIQKVLRLCACQSQPLRLAHFIPLNKPLKV